jgi:hypothetical protein
MARLSVMAQIDEGDMIKVLENDGYFVLEDCDLVSICTLAKKQPIEATHQLEKEIPELRDFREAMRRAIAK